MVKRWQYLVLYMFLNRSHKCFHHKNIVILFVFSWTRFISFQTVSNLLFSVYYNDCDGHFSQYCGTNKKKKKETQYKTKHTKSKKMPGIDRGQCMWYALNKCLPGVLSLNELNHQINNYHAERSAWGGEIPKIVAGIPNSTWHHSCIYKALKEKYGDENFRWKKVSFDGMTFFKQ